MCRGGETGETGLFPIAFDSRQWVWNVTRRSGVAGLGTGRGQHGASVSHRGGGGGWRRGAAVVALEQAIAEPFTPYYDLVDLGYSYRYYAEPPPTPVVTATLEFGEGRPDGDGAASRSPRGGTSDASSAAAGLGECAFHGCAGGQGSGPVTRARAGWRGPMRAISVLPGPTAGA